MKAVDVKNQKSNEKVKKDFNSLESEVFNRNEKMEIVKQLLCRNLQITVNSDYLPLSQKKRKKTNDMENNYMM